MTTKLKDARQKAGYSISEIANALKIRKEYIIALEEDNLQDIPGQIYVDGYTKIYCEFLNITCDNHSATPSMHKPRAMKNLGDVNTKFVIFASISILIASIAIYGFLKRKPSQSIPYKPVINKVSIYNQSGL